jgi:hypothetical protein
MRLSGLILAAASMCLGSATSFGFFDVEAMVGKRWYSFESTGSKATGVSSQEIGLAVHLDPIPLIPVGFGLGVLTGDLNKDDLGSGATEAKLLEVDFEVKAWIPMVPVVTPYVKIKVPVSSKLAVKGKTELDSNLPGEEEYAYLYKLSGYHANIGIQYGLIPLVKLNLEVGKGMQNYEVEEYKVASTKQNLSGFKKEKANSDNFMLGVQIGF